MPVIAGVWAHYDDDLLFGVPTIDRAVRDGHSVRNLFLTASDAGHGLSSYAAGRETGIRAAYNVMRGTSTAWSDRAEVLSNGVSVTMTSPDDDPRIALAFLRLPDGGLTGEGWYRTGYQTISKLLGGRIPAMTSLDTAQEFTVDRLVATIAAFVEGAAATAVVTNMPDFAPGGEGDHPDHGSAGRLVSAAVDQGLIDPSIVRYAVGYPRATWPANLDAQVAARKLAIFAAYGEHDEIFQRDPEAYLALPGLGDWLGREHLLAHDELTRSARSEGATRGR